MASFQLIDDFVNAFKSGAGTSQFIGLVDQQRPLGLSYSHIYHSLRAATRIGGFENRRVLEMGGALPSSFVFDKLNANRWVAVEYSKYIGNEYRITQRAGYSYDSTGWEEFFQKWKLTDGERFDVIYSIAAFEHIHDLNGCFDAMFDMLVDGGILYSYFSPIWSAPNGSHGFHPKEIDMYGGHAHLCFDFCSLQEFLISECSVLPSKACIAAHELYKNNQINRYSYEEYIKIFNASQFQEKIITPLGVQKISELYIGEKLSRINAFHPNMAISAAGFEIFMRK